ncbi:hypothetical protein D3C78_1854870 [compost metagenome]
MATVMTTTVLVTLSTWPVRPMHAAAISRQGTRTNLRDNSCLPVHLNTQSISRPPQIKPSVPTSQGNEVTMLMDLRSMPLASIR